ncbi:MAG: hypothetical protein IID33_17010, partial [Planctomycetes bacterium]|nr:hypothetical protein [Planctomycetota bacterium]
VWSLTVFDDTTGPALYAGGLFSSAGGEEANRIAKWGCPFPLGDMNFDGEIDALDIEPYLLALFEPDEYLIRFPNCDINNADINRDGSIDALDIEPFLNLLFP